MVKILPEATEGSSSVRHITLTDNDVLMNNLRAIRDGMSFMTAQPGKYAQLISSRGLEMSDTQMEWRTNFDFIRNANGRVLIAGLGIGLVLVPLLLKPEVEHIEVVEMNPEVIKLVSPHFKSKKLKVTQGDIYAHREQINGDKFDTIYFDIWPDISLDNLESMTQLCRIYRGALNKANPKAWMGCWTRDILRGMKRRGW